MKLRYDPYSIDVNTIKGNPLLTYNTVLTTGAIYESASLDITNFGIIYVAVFSDQQSAIDGLSIQQSVDNSNWDHSDDFTIPANKGKNFSINPHSRYLRIIYTNGDIDQTIFRLQVTGKVGGLPSSHRIKDDIISDDDARLVTSILKVQTNDEQTYVNVDVQNPLPTGRDSVYGRDIILDLSAHNNFVIPTEPTAHKRRILTSLVSDVYVEKLDDTTNNPKQIDIVFKRPVLTSSFGINSVGSGTFSNTKITIFQGENSNVVVDQSTDNTKHPFQIFDIPPLKFSRMLIEFYTSDPISMGLLGIFKNVEVAARLQALNDFNNVVDIKATNQGNLKMAIQEYGDTPSIDAFGRLRISTPYTIFDSKQLHDKQPLFWDELTGGSATSTHNGVNACVEMAVTASTSDFVIRQTRQRLNYQPGKSQLAFLTFYSPGSIGATIRVGMFDGTGINYLTPKNGIFFELNSVSSWNIAKNGVITEKIVQSNWNWDKLDGTGFSGKTLNLNSPQIAVIDYEWLGVGRVRVGFVIDGLIFYCHYFNHANIIIYDSVYMSTPNLPIRYSIESDGLSSAKIDHICSTVMSEGGLEKTGILRGIDSGATSVNLPSSGVLYAVLGLRLKTAYLDITAIPEFFSTIGLSNDNFRWSIHFNPVLAASLTYTDIPNSALQDAHGTIANIITNEGVKITSGYASTASRSSSGDLKTALTLGSKIDGTPDELILAIMPLNPNAPVLASLTVRELL